MIHVVFFFSSRRRHTRFSRDWSSDVCSSDLGPNGAGKTTAVRLLLGLTRPTTGTARLFGEDPTSLNARRRTGVMLQVAKIGRASCRERYSMLRTAEKNREKTGCGVISELFQ